MNEQEEHQEKAEISNEKSEKTVKKMEADSEIIKKGIGLGALVLGLYAMDRLLGEEKIIYLSDKKHIKVRKGFLEEFFEL